jgi:tRNA threonylcarbamoyladenosine biosynthesis protein TsaE
MTLIIESGSAHETKTWGRRLASLLEGGELLGLMGDLGAGKTCFVKGLASGLNLREGDILSPTFTMIQEHRGRLALYHIDLYRLEEAGIDDLGLREYLFTSGVTAALSVPRTAPDLRTGLWFGWPIAAIMLVYAANYSAAATTWP